MNESEEMKTQGGKKEELILWIKRMLPVWICMMLGIVVICRAWVGPYPAKWKMALACIMPFPLVALFGRIPLLYGWLAIIENFIVDWFRGLRNHNWKKNILVIVADIVLALAIERVLALVAKEGITADFNFRKAFFAFVITALISIFICYRDMLIKRVEMAVFLAVMLIGTVYVTVLPVSCGISWDDEAHFHNALMLSHILDGRMTLGDADILNGFVDTALEHNIYTEDAHEAWVEKMNADDASGVWGADGRILPTLQNWCYLPSAVGLALGRALSLPYSLVFILGKWCNLLVYAILLYFGIRKIKSGKMIAAVVGMLPPCILMASSYARDPWMIGFIMLGFCYFIGEIQEPDKKITIPDLVIMIGAFVLGVSPKAIYVPMVLIAAFLPKEKFATEKQCKIFRICVLLATLAVLATFAVPFILSSGGAVEDTRGGSGVDAAGQTAYILHHPIIYIQTLLTFLWDYASLEAGQTYLSYLHYFGTAKYSLVLQALLLVTAFTDREKCDSYVKWQPKVVTLLMSFGAICLAATAMYIAYTPLESDTILGCQYRYMLQVMFPVLYVFGSVRVENNARKDWYRGIIIGISSFVLLSAVWQLCISGF